MNPELLEKMGSLRWGLFISVMLGLMAYIFSFQVPFYFDDVLIFSNSAITKHLGLAAVWNSEATRPLTYLTFYLNHLLGGERPWGYHLISLLSHLATVTGVYLLVRTLSRTPNSGITSSESGVRYEFAAVVAASIFAVHPLNSQAVIYIVQRASLLAALFYVLAILAYLKTRLATSGAQRTKWFVTCAGAGMCAFMSKENSATLPLAILLVELIFFQISRKKFAVVGSLFLLVQIITVATYLYVQTAGSLSLEALDLETRGTLATSRSGYFAMQTQVLWHYIRLFGIPLGLHLEYEPPLASSWGDALVVLAAIAHSIVIGAALFFARKKPVLAFGVLFYYTAHLVESSVIPIPDVAFEHRTYLPNIGLCIVAGWLVSELYARYQNWRSNVVFSTTIVVVILLIITIQRNLLWQDPVAFFEQNTQVEPKSARAWGHLSTAYIDKQNYTGAFGSLQKVDKARLNGTTRDKYLVNLVISLAGMGRATDAIKVGRSVLDTKMIYDPKLRAVMLNSLAVSYGATGYGEQAILSLEEALQLDPNNQDVIRNYASVKKAGLR